MTKYIKQSIQKNFLKKVRYQNSVEFYFFINWDVFLSWLRIINLCGFNFQLNEKIGEININ